MGSREEVWYGIHYAEDTIGPIIAVYQWMPTIGMELFVPQYEVEARPVGKFVQIILVNESPVHLGMERFIDSDTATEDVVDTSGIHLV